VPSVEMAKNRTRKSGLVGFLWSPFAHLFMASGESAQQLGTTAGKIVKESIGAVKGVGNSFARHSNQAIGGLTGKRRNTRRNSRRNSRRNH
jgi:hypothetical protein